MSIQAVAWAIEQQEVKDPMMRFVLLCVSNYADAMGRNSFPAIGRLCQDTGYSESTVRRQLKKLEESAMIVKGNQAIAAAQISRGGYRPTVYDLVIRGVSARHPWAKGGVSATPPRGVQKAIEGCPSLTPDPKRSVGEPKSARARDGATDSRGTGEPEGRKALRNLVRGLKGNLQ